MKPYYINENIEIAAIHAARKEIDAAGTLTVHDVMMQHHLLMDVGGF